MKFDRSIIQVANVNINNQALKPKAPIDTPTKAIAQNEIIFLFIFRSYV